MLRALRLTQVSLLLLGLAFANRANAQDTPPPPPVDPNAVTPLPPTPPAPPAPPASPTEPTPPTPPTISIRPEHHGEHAEHHGEHDHEHCDCGGMDDRRPNFGGVGYAFGGLTMGSFRALDGALSSPSALGPGYGAATGALTYGGGGGALLFGRLWIGGKGFGMVIGTGDTPNGTSKLTAGGGTGELGFAAVNHSNWLVIPFVGLGGFGYSLSVQNLRSTAVPLSSYETLPAGGSRDFSAGFAIGEVGVRVMKLMFGGHMVVGGELGYMSALGRSSWTGPEGVNSGLESADLGAAYVRLLVGGGGFSYKGGR